MEGSWQTSCRLRVLALIGGCFHGFFGFWKPNGNGCQDAPRNSDTDTHTHTHSHTHTHLLRAQRVSRQSKSPKQSMSPRSHVDAARQQHCKTRMRVLSGLRFQGSGWYRDLKTSNWEPSAPSARQARHASASSAVRPSCGQVQGLSNFCFCYTS